ncbi:MAG: Clp protease N-terminal domain-containing protein [Propionibacteriaceae bacterium]|nr:Clp protease N-terminal domain-containing protein [Propionibacteriaceae bacterium]
MNTEWTQQVSALAEEEQRRSHCPQVEAEHLLLAMLHLDDAVGDALRQQGVSLEVARQACEHVHPVEEKEAGTPGETRFREGVQATLERAANQPLPDVALLQLLLQDPSERTTKVLQELRIAYENLRLPTQKKLPPPDLQITHQSVVPAPSKAVWAVVSDPSRLHEWASFVFDHCELDPTGVPITWSDPGTKRHGLLTVVTDGSRSENLILVERPLKELRWDIVEPENRTTPPAACVSPSNLTNREPT